MNMFIEARTSFTISQRLSLSTPSSRWGIADMISKPNRGVPESVSSSTLTAGMQMRTKSNCSEALLGSAAAALEELADMVRRLL
jgi:hypothetical protein